VPADCLQSGVNWVKEATTSAAIIGTD
jgi:hypothetical protein